MSIDLTMLVLSAILCVVLLVPYSFGVISKHGLPLAAGNRENMPPLSGWIGRARRAHSNMVENLIPFAAIVLATHVAGKAGALTAIGAQLFFYARLAHAAIYIAGIAYLRTLAFAAGVAGMVLIVMEYFG